MKLELLIPLTNKTVTLDAEPVLRGLGPSATASLLVESAMSNGVEPGRIFSQIERLANEVDCSVSDALEDYREERGRLNRRLNEQSGHGLDGDEMATWYIDPSSCEEWLIAHRPELIKPILKKADEMGMEDDFQTLRAFSAAAAANKLLAKVRTAGAKKISRRS